MVISARRVPVIHKKKRSSTPLPNRLLKMSSDEVFDGQFQCVDCGGQFEEQSLFYAHLMDRHGWKEEECVTGQKAYEVESIVSHRWDAKEKDFAYMVRWVGYEEPTEIFTHNFGDDSVLLKEYNTVHSVDLEKPKSRRSKSIRTSSSSSRRRSKSKTPLAKRLSTSEEISALEVVEEEEDAGNRSEKEDNLIGNKPVAKRARIQLSPTDSTSTSNDADGYKENSVTVGGQEDHHTGLRNRMEESIDNGDRDVNVMDENETVEVFDKQETSVVRQRAVSNSARRQRSAPFSPTVKLTRKRHFPMNPVEFEGDPLASFPEDDGPFGMEDFDVEALDAFMENRRVKRILGIAVDPNNKKNIVYLFRFSRLEGEMSYEACRYVPSELAWTRPEFSKYIRRFYEGMTVKFVE